MFSFKLINPHPLLQNFIEKFHLFEVNENKQFVQNLIPSNMQNIGFVLSGSMESYYDNGSKRSYMFDDQLLISRSYVLGQLSNPITATYNGNVKVLAVVFKPAGMYQLFGIPMCDFTNRGVDFELIAGPEGKYFVEKIFETTSLEKQIAIIEKYLLQRLDGKHCDTAKRIDYASNLILRKNGNVRVKHLLNEVNMGERNFERNFVEKVGVSHKTFIGIARINKALQMIEAMPKFTWTDITYQLNYTDQAHFIHDFEKFSGKSPTEYFSSKTNFEHFIYGA